MCIIIMQNHGCILPRFLIFRQNALFFAGIGLSTSAFYRKSPKKIDRTHKTGYNKMYDCINSNGYFHLEREGFCYETVTICSIIIRE